jgi:predicted lipoprotein with Yx(FWY)xxD motif
MTSIRKVASYACRLLPPVLCALPLHAGAGSPVSGQGVLTNPDGFTLYTFDYDETNKSNCYLSCLGSWTPLRANGTDRPSGRLSILERKSGERQWALDGRPLYLFNGDLDPGDVRGERLGWAWHAIPAYPRPGILEAPARAQRPAS